MNETLLNFYDFDTRKKLRANPRIAFERLGERTGERLHDDVEVKLVENTADTIYIACPMLPNEAQALSQHNLQQITAGVDVGSASTISTASSGGTASSASTTVSTISSVGSAGCIGSVDTG